jgi:UDP-4-amino-4,6-dideoxy-N-acetyl-beta-L-altrosamine transaminase
MIPYGRQDITTADIEAVIEVLKSDFLTQGPVVPRFEAAVASHVGAKYAVAVNSATSALHIACLALGLGRGDILWTTPITFVASANCGVYCGATVDFVDIDTKTYNICPRLLRKKLESARDLGRLPNVIVLVHFSGQPCDLQGIALLSQEFGFRIIEDASHAIGAKYKDEFVGNCKYSDITVFSFHPVKIITTGEGGMALTNSDDLARAMMLLRTHGINRDPAAMRETTHGPWYYEQIELGFNYRMTDIQAALGISQLGRLDDYVARRQQLAMRYGTLFSGFPITLPWQHPDSYSALHLYVIRLQIEKIDKSHLQVFNAMRDLGVGVQLHYIPVHLHPFYQRMGFRKGDFPNAEAYYMDAISLPMFSLLTDSDQDCVVNALELALES